MGVIAEPAPDPTRPLVAIDGGNSKTDVLVYDSAGSVLARTRGPGVSQHVHGAAGAVLHLERMIEEALATAGLSRGRGRIALTAAYLAGVDLPREQQQLHDAARARDWSDALIVDNDTFALFRLGAPEGRGVAVVCGAGINCVAFGDGGAVIRFPSLGDISGDWGGGARLATEVMYAASRAEDGRGPATALRDAVASHFGTRDVLGVIEELHFGGIPRERLHELNPVLFSAASAGDRVSRDLLDHLASELANYALAALARLHLLDEAVPVVLGGSILATRHELLFDGIRRRLLARAPRAEMVVVDAAPVFGAALLGLDSVFGAAPASAERRLREAMAQ